MVTRALKPERWISETFVGTSMMSKNPNRGRPTQPSRSIHPTTTNDGRLPCTYFPCQRCIRPR
jgi:hypothetical protein